MQPNSLLEELIAAGGIVEGAEEQQAATTQPQDAQPVQRTAPKSSGGIIDTVADVGREFVGAGIKSLTSQNRGTDVTGRLTGTALDAAAATLPAIGEAVRTSPGEIAGGLVGGVGGAMGGGVLGAYTGGIAGSTIGREADEKLYKVTGGLVGQKEDRTWGQNALWSAALETASLGTAKFGKPFVEKVLTNPLTRKIFPQSSNMDFFASAENLSKPVTDVEINDVLKASRRLTGKEGMVTRAEATMGESGKWTQAVLENTGRREAYYKTLKERDDLLAKGVDTFRSGAKDVKDLDPFIKQSLTQYTDLLDNQMQVAASSLEKQYAKSLSTGTTYDSMQKVVSSTPNVSDTFKAKVQKLMEDTFTSKAPKNTAVLVGADGRPIREATGAGRQLKPEISVFDLKQFDTNVKALLDEFKKTEGVGSVEGVMYQDLRRAAYAMLDVNAITKGAAYQQLSKDYVNYWKTAETVAQAKGKATALRQIGLNESAQEFKGVADKAIYSKVFSNTENFKAFKEIIRGLSASNPKAVPPGTEDLLDATYRNTVLNKVFTKGEINETAIESVLRPGGVEATGVVEEMGGKAFRQHLEAMSIFAAAQREALDGGSQAIQLRARQATVGNVALLSTIPQVLGLFRSRLGNQSVASTTRAFFDPKVIDKYIATSKISLDDPRALASIAQLFKHMMDVGVIAYEELKYPTKEEIEATLDKAIGINKGDSKDDIKVGSSEEFMQLFMGQDGKASTPQQGASGEVSLTKEVQDINPEVKQFQNPVENDPIGQLIKDSESQPKDTNAKLLEVLKAEEGFRADAYVPQRDGKVIGQSGVTIGKGFDVGQHDVDSLEKMGFSPELVAKLAPFAGKTGVAAQKALKANPVTLSPGELQEVTEKVMAKQLKKIEGVVADIETNRGQPLTENQKIAIGSMVYQGISPTSFPNSFKAFVEGDIEKARRGFLNSKWATKQTPERAQRTVKALLDDLPLNEAEELLSQAGVISSKKRAYA